MASEDKYLTVEIFNAGISEIKGEISGLKKQVDILALEVRDNSRDIAHLQTSIYWGFAIVAIVVALIGFVVTLAPMFTGLYKDLRNRREDRELDAKIKTIVDAAISRAMSDNRRG